MAFSSSIKRAQAIKLCELCNEDNIKWRCIDCDRCLCQKCKTIHLKVPVTAKHQIVTIATPIKEVQRKIAIDNIPCKNHVTKMHCLFCKTCEFLVCPDCVSTSHGNHKFIPIEEALDNKLKQLRENQTKCSENLKVCDSKTTEIQSLIPKYESLFDESVVKIKQKEKELKTIISKHAMELQENIEYERSKVKAIAKQIEENVRGARKKLESLNQKLEQALGSNQGQFILDTTVKTPVVLEFDPFPNEVKTFTLEADTERQIKELFGSFETVIIPIIQPEFSFEVLRTFTTDLPSIHQVLPLDESSAWISCGTTDTVKKSVMRKVSIQDNNIRTTIETTLDVYSMTLTSDNDILQSMNRGSDIKLMTKSGEIKHFMTVSPLIPRGICATSDKQIIVCAREPGDPFTLTEKSERVVIVFDSNGKQIHKYQNDKNGKRLFTVPFRVTANYNKDLIVIDFTSASTGRLVTLDQDGNLKWIYDGHSKFNAIESFRPEDITTTDQGYIVVCDYIVNTVHVLSENGEVLTCKVMYDIGIMDPLAVNIDRGGRLWVGCGSRQDTGAKLHIVKLTV